MESVAGDLLLLYMCSIAYFHVHRGRFTSGDMSRPSSHASSNQRIIQSSLTGVRVPPYIVDQVPAIFNQNAEVGYTLVDTGHTSSAPSVTTMTDRGSPGTVSVEGSAQDTREAVLGVAKIG